MSIKIASWNVRGFNDPSKHREVFDFVHKKNIQIMSLLETKVKHDNEANIFGKSFKNWNLLSNSNSDSTARIWVCWDPQFCNIVSISKSTQFVFCRMTILEGNTSFHAIFVYAENDHVMRLPFFDVMCSISKSYSSFPLICLGDFNAVRFSHEKLGGYGGWNSNKEVFNNTILDADLEDLSFKGCQFTWSNKRSGDQFITSKIDRVLVNENWLNCYPNSSAMFLPAGISDHSPALVTIDPKGPNLRKPFKFFDFWADHADFIPIVNEVWRKYVKGSPMFRVCQKLKTLKPIFKSLNKKEYSEISTRVVHAKELLLSSQIRLDKDPLNSVLQNEERAACAKYVDLCSVEEKLVHQKSRVQWLGLGDRNSSFFLRALKAM